MKTKKQIRSIWLAPYITDTLNMRVISYNVPIFWRGQFIGVIGIEIDYSTLAEQVDSIRLFSTGCAYVNNENGELFYHPFIDVTGFTEETKPETPQGVNSKDTFFKYTYEGVEKRAVWLPLKNGMRINVAVPESETEGNWKSLVFEIVIFALVILAAAVVFTMIETNRITRPIKQLTRAADQIEHGNYDADLEYDKNDEVGKLTKTFKHLSDHMKEHINDLNNKVNIDALTRVKNKGHSRRHSTISRGRSQAETAI